MQEGFCTYYIQSKLLYIESKELEILKDFLGRKVENLNLKLSQLESEKEDLMAQQLSNHTIKEHLMKKVTDLENINMEKGTQILF
jgi:hypothetical protein